MKEKRLLNNHGSLFIVEGKIIERKIHGISRKFFRVGKEEYPLFWTKPLSEATEEELTTIKDNEAEAAKVDLMIDEILGR